jgi:hypothetical protein
VHFFPLEAPSCQEAKGFCLMVLLLEVNFIKRLKGSPKKIFRIIINFEKIEYLLNIFSLLISYHILSYL